ncbi:hypothetical protein [Silvimonas iriomotensis]|uniref:Uncharacterized protein n=1 Tax=Silvimonas iriomotensis TaxID=449662 RepID=A0ABQ2P471_9NEIS|nr:hypothetical protein [Silvimonas iriomotensis]GGP17867.1 hypothetical protein GCM10010970_01950 [Silvimonas iriomotensis]
MPRLQSAQPETAATRPEKRPAPASQDHYLGSVSELLVAGVVTMLLERYYQWKSRRSAAEKH